MTRRFATVAAVLYACFVAFVAPPTAHAAPGDLLYTSQSHGWNGSATDSGVAGGVDSAGNYYAAGYGEIAEGTAGFLAAKVTPAGVLDWLLPWAPSVGEGGEAFDAVVSPSGELITVGFMDAVSGGSDVQLVSRDAAGALAWTANWSGPGNRADGATAVARAADGSLYVVGSGTAGDGDRDVITLKFGPTGELIWARRYNSPWDRNDGAGAVCLYGHSVYVAGSVAHPDHGTDVALIKYDTNGVRKWVRLFDGSRHRNDVVQQVVANGSSVYVAGAVTTAKGRQDMVLRYRPAGAFVWMRASGGSPPAYYPQITMWNDVAIAPGGEAVVTGTRWTGWDGQFDWATAVYRPGGALAWSKRVSGFDFDGGDSVAIDPDGLIYVAGARFRASGQEHNTDGTVICYQPDGTKQWMTSTGFPSPDALTDVSLSSDRVYATGSSIDPTYWYEFLVVEIEK